MQKWKVLFLSSRLVLNKTHLFVECQKSNSFKFIYICIKYLINYHVSFKLFIKIPNCDVVTVEARKPKMEFLIGFVDGVKHGSPLQVTTNPLIEKSGELPIQKPLLPSLLLLLLPTGCLREHSVPRSTALLPLPPSTAPIMTAICRLESLDLFHSTESSKYNSSGYNSTSACRPDTHHVLTTSLASAIR